MQILHINSNYLTSKLHENLLDRLENRDIHNTVFMPIKRETEEEFLYDSKHEVYHPASFREIDKFIFTYKQRKIYKKLHQIIKPKSYEIIHAHTLFTDGNIAYKLNKNYGTPYIVTVRGFTDIDEFFNKRINLRKRGRQILKNATQIIFLSETNRKDLLGKYINDVNFEKEILKKSQIIPNGIDAMYFEHRGLPKTINPSRPLKFIQVGQIRERKNGLGSVRAIKDFMEKTGQQAELLFVGRVVEEDYFEEIKWVGKNFVSHQPLVDSKELIKIFRKNDIFIMPSFSETFGLVYPEAMSQGLPVIYTKGQGFDGQYEDGYIGYPVQAKNIEDIVEKIENIVENYEELSKNAVQAIERFNWDTLAQNYKAIYNTVVSRNEENV